MAAPAPNRPLVVGDPSGPFPPYPLRMSGQVISGFGRGSKELGIPTANLPVDDALTPWISSVPSGVYFGWASLNLPPSHPDSTPTPTTPTTTETEIPDWSSSSRTRGANGFTVYPMVMSIGYNPFYKNTVRSAEVHVLHDFGADFYGAEMRLLITGFIREEKDYSGLEALIADIKFDCEVAKRSLAREGWAPRGVDVEIDLPGEAGEDRGVEKVVMRGELDCAWLIRPSQLPKEKGDEEGK
ncbi:riboflavin kinase [Parathielavia appendiculata]|uniref:Riboflavin kinase n=1 Tax=Parathielavia appendiculata TaxID=2587402 RepID=A0AAN6U972_9PEZI|nr:riboflavin kinase [Parathielavia appendiculata]